MSGLTTQELKAVKNLLKDYEKVIAKHVVVLEKLGWDVGVALQLEEIRYESVKKGGRN